MRSLLLLLVLEAVALSWVSWSEAQEEARIANAVQVTEDFYRAWSE